MSPQGEGSGSFAWRRLEHALPAPAAFYSALARSSGMGSRMLRPTWSSRDVTSTDADAAIGAFLALPAAAILQAGLSVYLTRHEVVDSDLTREQPPSARTAKVASTATAR
jgi:hypothetical protein